jgi:CheY-like chemotaxis protein
LDDEAWPVLCDANQLESAILNLCINARDAMPGGGCITIRTQNSSIGERATPDFVIRAGDYVAVSVGDSGCGMTPEVMERAFDPFFTTKPIGQGTGLGLSMIHGFVEQSGGRARIVSAPGDGTTITLYLPRHEGGALDEAPVVNEVDHSPSSERGATVLVVDDEAAIRMLIIDVLRDFGYSCLEAGDSASAFAIMQSCPSIDLLITDVGLPGGMNGHQLARAGREVWPKLKVLLITGYADAAVTSDQLGPGMRLLAKPFTLDVLTGCVNALCAETLP